VDVASVFTTTALQVHKMSGSTDMVPLERQLRDLVIQFQKHIARQKGPALLKRW
jgi:hypothetical protein